MKPVLLVCGCEKYRASLIEALRRFKNSAWTTVGCIGDPTLMAPHFDMSVNIVYLPVQDTYEQLPAKIHAAFSWIHSQWPDAPGIFKTDEDIYVHRMKDLVKAVRENEATPYWGFKIGRCAAADVHPVRIASRFNDTTLRPKHQAAIYTYGHGYWVSREALQHVLAAGDEYRSSFLEDVCTGHILNKKRIFPVHVAVPYTEQQRK